MRISDWSSDVCSSDLRHGADIGLIAHGDARLAAADLDRNDLRRIDADEAVVEPLATCLARRDRIGEGLIAVVVAQVAQRVAVARPIGLEDHAVRRLGALHETAGVEMTVAREQRAQARFRGGLIAAVRRTGRRTPRSAEHTSALPSNMRISN